MSIVLHTSWGIWIIFLFVLYTAVQLTLLEQGALNKLIGIWFKREKINYFFTQQYCLLGLVAAGVHGGRWFPWGQKGMRQTHGQAALKRILRCLGRNIPSIIPNATAQVLLVYEENNYRKWPGLCFPPWTASPTAIGRCTGPGRQLLCPRMTFLMDSYTASTYQ